MTSTEVGWNVGLELGQAQKCGRVKDVNGIPSSNHPLHIYTCFILIMSFNSGGLQVNR